MSVIVPDSRGLIVIPVQRGDYTTCREPVVGQGHCNAAVPLWTSCSACAVRKGLR